MSNQKNDEKKQELFLDEGMPWRFLPTGKVEKVTTVFQEFYNEQNPNREVKYHEQRLSDFINIDSRFEGNRGEKDSSK
ncbi:hypothetical protein HB665_24035 [Bacillus paranthracis]|uniref:hypothetical protein n=1 Tax=Bacillus cereus group TaxID=86661 RepID=UPI0014442BFC|nr:hypothetical protein [Bacillus paranthracis]NKX27197.1 hypothetical protein [Bacillus paranthracis]